jgi:prophage maintenance system killer protein
MARMILSPSPFTYFGIAMAHGFEQGNQRTGLTAAAMFLSMNGYELADSEEMGGLVREVIIVAYSRGVHRRNHC